MRSIEISCSGEQQNHFSSQFIAVSDRLLLRVLKLWKINARLFNRQF